MRWQQQAQVLPSTSEAHERTPLPFPCAFEEGYDSNFSGQLIVLSAEYGVDNSSLWQFTYLQSRVDRWAETAEDQGPQGPQGPLALLIAPCEFL